MRQIKMTIMHTKSSRYSVSNNKRQVSIIADVSQETKKSQVNKQTLQLKELEK